MPNIPMRQCPSRSATSAELGFDYYLNQNAIIFARYQHIDFTPTVAGSSFSDDNVHIGLSPAPVTPTWRVHPPLERAKARRVRYQVWDAVVATGLCLQDGATGSAVGAQS
jgi:hypothetical protein